MEPNWQRLKTVPIADQGITVMIGVWLHQRMSVMKDIIALRVKTSAIHSAAQLESTVLEEVLNLKTVLQGHLLKARYRLCVLNVLRASTAYQNLLSQVSNVHLILSLQLYEVFFLLEGSCMIYKINWEQKRRLYIREHTFTWF